MNMLKNITLSLALCAGIGFTGTVVATPASAAEEIANSIPVTIDRAKILRISRPADTIIIGNPAIVDATIQDSKTLVLTGRSFGVTNLVILDHKGDPVVDETIVVRGHETNTVRIYRRAVRETLACAPVCEATVTIGDARNNFNNSATQINQRNSLADNTAAAGTR